MEIKLIPLQSHGDERGSLVALEDTKNIPFIIRRVYYMFDTKDGITRGYHAHYNLKQVAIAVKGSCKFILDDGEERKEVLLDRPTEGLLIDSIIWREITDFSTDCVLMVLASNYYDESDYIRNYAEFLQVKKNEM